jgi:Cdc6-like AAA superfamily ATPase
MEDEVFVLDVLCLNGGSVEDEKVLEFGDNFVIIEVSVVIDILGDCSPHSSTLLMMLLLLMATTTLSTSSVFTLVSVACDLDPVASPTTSTRKIRRGGRKHNCGAVRAA